MRQANKIAWLIVLVLVWALPVQAQLNRWKQALTEGHTTLQGGANPANALVMFDTMAVALDSVISALQKYGKNAGDYATLQSALDEANTDTGLVVLSQSMTITASTRDTMHAQATLWPRRGAQFRPTRKFTFQGTVIDPGPIQWIWSNPDSVEFLPGSVDYVRPEWFTEGDSTSAINLAVKSHRNTNGVVKLLPNKTYYFDDTIDGISDSTQIIGSLPGTVINRAKDDTVFAIYGTNSSTRIDNVVIDGVWVFSASQADTSPAIYGQYFGKTKFTNFRINNITGPAFYLLQPWDVEISYGRVDQCGSDGDSTQAGLTIRSGTGDVANNVRVHNVTFENPYGGHIAILGEHTSVDHDFYFTQCKFHGWSAAGDRTSNQPTSPHFYADSVQGVYFNQTRWVWSPASGPIIELESVGGFSVTQSVFSDQTDHPALDIEDSKAISFIGNAMQLGSGKDSTAWFGNLADSNNVFMLLNNQFVSGPSQAAWTGAQVTNDYFYANDKQILRDTTDVNFARFTNQDSADQATVWELFPSDVSELKVRLRSDGHLLFNLGGASTVADVYSDAAGQLVSLQGFDAGNGALEGGSLIKGNNSFTTSATADTVLISGVTSNDVFVVAIKDATPVADDLLSYSVNTDTLFVYRVAGTTSGLNYSYVRIKNQ